MGPLLKLTLVGMCLESTDMENDIRSSNMHKLIHRTPEVVVMELGATPPAAILLAEVEAIVLAVVVVTDAIVADDVNDVVMRDVAK